MPAPASPACDASGVRRRERFGPAAAPPLSANQSDRVGPAAAPPFSVNRSERFGPAAALPAARPPLTPAWLVIASLIMEGRPDQVRTARQFIAQAVGDDHPRSADALLLGSELVTNAVVHSRSGMPGGAVRVVIARSPHTVH